jgi:hypothetical protein
MIGIEANHQPHDDDKDERKHLDLLLDNEIHFSVTVQKKILYKPVNHRWVIAVC